MQYEVNISHRKILNAPKYVRKPGDYSPMTEAAQIDKTKNQIIDIVTWNFNISSLNRNY